MKHAVSMAKETVPSPTAGSRATTLVFVLCILGMLSALASLILLWMGYPLTVSSTALAESAVAERMLAALHWSLTQVPHLLPVPMMNQIVGGGPTDDLMMVEPKTFFA